MVTDRARGVAGAREHHGVDLPPELPDRARYSRVLALLDDAGGACGAGELTRLLAAREGDPDVERYRTLYLWLHRTAIPTLATLGAVEYAEATDEVRLRGPD